MELFWHNKKVIITGANGFLGSHLYLRLFREKAKVTGIIKENLHTPLLDKELKRSDLKIVKTDIVDFEKILSVFKDIMPQICLHVAAQPIVGIANNSPLATLETNIKGTWNILEASRITKTRAVIVASSDKAYGEHRKLPYTEDSGLLALHPYDASKACADIITRVYAHTYALNTAVTRCANIYGPGDLNFSRIIPDTIRSIISGKDPVIRSDGTPLRDYVYIDDVVDAYLSLARRLYNKQISPGEVFNFGTGKPISVIDLVNKLLIISGMKDLRPEILSKSKIKGEIDKQYLSSNKSRRILNWRPRYSLDEGLRKTFLWYRQIL